MTTTDNQPETGGCPVHTFNPTEGGKQAGEWVATYDRMQQLYPLFRSDFGPFGGFVVPLRHEDILSIMQDATTFSSSAVTVMDPNPPYKWIPEMLDPPEHTEWRRQLAPLFSPREATRLEDKVRRRAIELIDAIKDEGSCDFGEAFSNKFPTTIFLELLGLPVEELDTFLGWEAGILHGDPGSAEGQAQMAQSMGEVMGYFAQVIEKRRVDPQDDIVSKAIGFTIKGQPPTDEDLLAFCLLMFMAGLDTVTQNLNYGLVHLAKNPQDQERIVADPSLIPGAVEEIVRAFSIVVPARKALKDTEIRGCPVKAGEMVLIALSAANRDERVFKDGTTVQIDRPSNHHLGFGAGPHRCLGSHLARAEMRIALEEWHARIPRYRLNEDKPAPVEHGGMYGLDEVHLIWDS